MGVRVESKFEVKWNAEREKAVAIMAYQSYHTECMSAYEYISGLFIAIMDERRGRARVRSNTRETPLFNLIINRSVCLSLLLLRWLTPHARWLIPPSLPLSLSPSLSPSLCLFLIFGGVVESANRLQITEHVHSSETIQRPGHPPTQPPRGA